MIDASRMGEVAAAYPEVRVGVLGSHSALEIMDGTKDEGFRTVVFCRSGREEPYRRFGRIADEIVVLEEFGEMASDGRQAEMIESGTIIVPHRSLTAYLGYETIENRFAVPIFGNRSLFAAEERTVPRGQYYLLEKAGIRYPRVLRDPSGIDGPCIVKVQESARPLERAFFTVSSHADYEEKSSAKVAEGVISEEGLADASIEELVIGTYMNFNFFYTPISEQVDFMGIERRLQTDIHDYNALPARQQMDIGLDRHLQNIEVGHTPASIRESLLEGVLRMGDKFVDAVRREYHPGIIGPFSLQSVITRDLEMVVYDVSLRVPGNPIVATTSPYTKYQYGETFGVGRRIGMEMRRAINEGRLDEIVT